MTDLPLSAEAAEVGLGFSLWGSILGRLEGRACCWWDEEAMTEISRERKCFSREEGEMCGTMVVF